MQKIAKHLGHKEDSLTYHKLAESVKTAFNNQFYVGGERVYENGSQTGLAMAIYLGLATDKRKTEALAALVRDIENKSYSLTSGEVGFCHLVKTLQQEGRGDILFTMNHNADKPGYAYQLKKGATSLTESWQAYDNVSHNHFMLGHLMEWLYGGIGGIRQAQNSIAWKHIVIAPQMVGSVTWAKSSLLTPNGVVRCSWKRSADSTKWSIKTTIPAGSTAEVHLPNGRIVKVESGQHKFDNKTKI
jgi:hypothetical protein